MSQDLEAADPSLTETLLRDVQRELDNLAGTLEGPGEHDARRPMTPTGTSLLPLVKNVLSVELGHLAECVGRPSGIELPWSNEDAVPDRSHDRCVGAS